MITKRNFSGGMRRLEQVFNKGETLKETVREEYFKALCYEKPQVFDEAIQLVIESFKPYLAEPFPSVATVKIATLRAVDEEEPGRETPSQGTQQIDKPDFCEQCRNQGYFLGQDNQARFCDCEKGRFRQAAWSVGSQDRKRQEKIQLAINKLPPAQPPHCGLKEWNPIGFYEDTQEQHDKWMALKRAEIAEMDARRAKAKGLGKEAPKTGIPEAISEVLGLVSEFRAGHREPGDDGEEDAERAF